MTAPTGWLSCPNWADFQHYKDRDPPWIKLHRQVLDNYEWSRLQDASKAHLTGIWLLLARHRNRIPADPAWIGQRIAATTYVDLQPLVAAGFLELEHAASATLAPCKQSAMPEAEAEAEVSSNGVEERGALPSSPKSSACWTPDQRAAAKGWRMAASDPRAFDAIVKQAAEERLVGGGFGWPIVGQALLEMRGTPSQTFSLVWLLGCCRNLAARKPAAEPTTNVTDDLGRSVPCREADGWWVSVASGERVAEVRHAG